MDKHIQETALREFKWGVCDCLIFACDTARIVSGKDPMSKKLPDDPETIRGQYSSEKEARLLIKEHRKSLMGIMDLHFERVDPAFAQRGDIVLKKLDSGLTFGVVWSGKAFFKTLMKGLHSQPVPSVKIAWRVE